MDPLFENPQALGEALRKARERAGMSQEALATALGTTRQRLSKWEQGKEPAERPRKPAERRAFTIAVAELTQAPRDLLGLPAASPAPLTEDEAIQILQRAVGALATLVTAPALDPAARQLLERELAAARQWSTNIPPIEEPGSG